MFAAVLAFAGVAAIINATPGLDMMLVLRTSVASGRRSGLAAAVGVNTGCLAWGIATAAGLSVLLTASHVAFDVVRIAGATYLTWLGTSALWHARRQKADKATAGTETSRTTAARTAAVSTTTVEPTTADTTTSHTATPGTTATEPTTSEPTAPLGRFAAFRSGLGTNLLNPKAGIFYMSLLPQFIPHGAQVFGSTLLLTAVDVAELSVLYFVVSGAAAALAGRLAKTSFRRRMEQVSGIVFLGFAASLVWERS